MVYRPNMIACYVDADFIGGWDQAHTNNTENIMALLGYVITYTGYLVLWCSNLQIEIALSTQE